MRATGIAGALLIAATMTACMREPTVEVTGVGVRGIGLRGVSLAAELRITNPNRLALEADSIRFELEANDPGEPNAWTPVTSGTSTQRVRIEGREQSEVAIPIELSYGGLATPARALFERGNFNYRIHGRVFVRRPLPARVPFSEEGNLSLGGS